MAADEVRTAPAMGAIVIYVVSPVLYWTAEWYSSQAYTPLYSYYENFTSDLGVPYSHTKPATGIPILSGRAHIMNLNFVLKGVLFLAGQIFFLRATALRFDTSRNRTRTINAFLYCFGIILVAAVPGGPKQMENGSAVWHLVGALFAIAGGNINSILAGISAPLDRPLYRQISRALGIFGLVVFTGFLGLQFVVAEKGLLQRMAIYPTNFWELSTAALLTYELLDGRKQHNE